MAAGLRLELSFPVLETSALANVLTRNMNATYITTNLGELV